METSETDPSDDTYEPVDATKLYTLYGLYNGRSMCAMELTIWIRHLSKDAPNGKGDGRWTYFEVENSQDIDDINGELRTTSYGIMTI